jgi:alkanesulfonate monooxygenase SsuD/methylene tetrahydromethanopterin reductase-like flavin-dependent oxidoreductase (luciferase family)
MSTPDIGVILPTMSRPGELPGDIGAAARRAEDLGFESGWVVDQLVAGTGAPFVESTVALTVAAGATSRLRLGYGVLILPLHQVTWVAKRVASVQLVSGGRVILGVGVGGDRHDRSWAAAGLTPRGRGRRTDAALRVLPGLIAGEPTVVDDLPDAPTVQLAPGAPVPPIVIAGMSDAAVARAAAHDGWFPLPVPPAAVAEGRGRLAKEAAALGRPEPAVTATLMVALEGDPALPDREGLARLLTDPDGMFAIPPDAVDAAVVRGRPADVASHIADHAGAGASRVVVSFAGGDWHRQAELLADAVALLS